MKATVQNIVTKHTSTGAKKVQTDTENIGKAQTRLGQASASAGRQFSAQATGLGGIVSAYAGAAANIFALTAAFFALRKAAEFTEIIAGTQALASSIGASAESLVANVQTITKSQLSLLDTVQQVNLGLVSGFDSSQISELSDVSLKASKALGRNLADAFQRVVRGAAKLEPELLDELGIFTRIDPAVRKYADSVGRSVTSLTNFERRQAFVNAVIEEGQRKFRDVDTSTRSAAVSLQTLAATITDIGLKFGAALSEFIAPFADFISGNVSNAIALFGVLARVVGAQAVNVFSSGIQSASTSIENFGNKVALAFDKLNKSYREGVVSAIAYSQTAARVTNLGTIQENRIKQEAAALLLKNATLETLTRAEVKNTIATLNSAIAAEKAFKARTKSAASSKRAEQSINRLSAALRRYNAVQNSGVKGTALFAAGLGKIAGGVALIGRAIAGAINLILRFTVFLSLAQLALDFFAKTFGFQEVNLIEKVGEILKSIIDFFKSNTQAVKSFAGSFAEVRDELKDLGLSAAEQSNILTEVSKAYTKFFESTQGVLFESTRSQKQVEALKKLKNEFDDPILRNVATDVFQQLVGTIDLFAARINVAKTNLLSFAISLQTLGKISGVSVSKIVGLIDDPGGKSATLPKNFDIAAKRSGELFLNIGKSQVQITKLVDGTIRLNRVEKEFISATLGFLNKLNQFNKDFEAGALTAEKATQNIKALENEISRIKQFQIRQAENLSEKRKEELTGQILRLQLEKNIAEIRALQLVDLEKQSKLLDKILGKPQEKLDRLRLTGTLGAGGQLSQTSGEAQFNQVDALKQLVLNGDRVRATITATDSELGEQLKKLKAQQTELLGINEIAKKGGLSQERILDLAEKKRFVENEIEETLKGINKQNAANEKILELESRALKSLLLIRNEVLKKAREEVDKLNVKKLQQEQKLFEINTKINTALERRQLVVQKAITAELIAQGEAQTKFLKDIGGLSAQEDITRTDAANVLKISLGQADKDFADKQAGIQRDLTIKRLESDNKIREVQAKTSLANVKALIGVINALNSLANLLDDQAIRSGLKLPRQLSRELKSLVSPALSVDGKAIPTGRQPGRLNKLVFETENNNKKILESSKNLAEQEFRLKIDSNSMTFKALRASLARELAIKEQNAQLSVRLFKGINTAVRDNLSKGLNDFFDAIANGTLTLKNFREGFNQFLFNILNDIRKQLLKETLTDPLSDMATGALKGLFNIGGNTSAIGAASTSAFNSGVNLSAYGGGIPPDSFSYASGGPVKHLAAGGMQRDRVPALLEPGEFVMKRSAARSIGESNLSSMNATGSMGGNVSVNIHNEGTPQEATQQSQPKFDGEKFVIDIVTRDLRNNGPIRKSLRGAG